MELPDYGYICGTDPSQADTGQVFLRKGTTTFCDPLKRLNIPGTLSNIRNVVQFVFQRDKWTRARLVCLTPPEIAHAQFLFGGLPLRELVLKCEGGAKHTVIMIEELDFPEAEIFIDSPGTTVYVCKLRCKKCITHNDTTVIELPPEWPEAQDG